MMYRDIPKDGDADRLRARLRRNMTEGSVQIVTGPERERIARMVNQAMGEARRTVAVKSGNGQEE